MLDIARKHIRNVGYSEEELGEWIDKVAEMTQQAETVYVLFNNHYQGQAVLNAFQFTEMLKEVDLPVFEST